MSNINETQREEVRKLLLMPIDCISKEKKIQ